MTKEMRISPILSLAGLALAGVLTPSPAVTAAPADPMKEPLQLIACAKKASAKVDDCTCTLVKRETLSGTLSAKQVIDLKVRKSPFSVFMRWREPKSLEGQEVAYVAGENDGKMRVKASGWRGLIGFVSLSINDRRARESSNHPITETGIGSLIDQFGKGWKMEQKLGKTKVQISNKEFAGRKCTRVELIHSTSAGGKLLSYRNVVYFDKQNHLPIGVENYDWPDTPGGAGDLVEMFEYRNLRLNVDLADSVFEH